MKIRREYIFYGAAFVIGVGTGYLIGSKVEQSRYEKALGEMKAEQQAYEDEMDRRINEMEREVYFPETSKKFEKQIAIENKIKEALEARIEEEEPIEVVEEIELEPGQILAEIDENGRLKTVDETVTKEGTKVKARPSRDEEEIDYVKYRKRYYERIQEEFDDDDEEQREDVQSDSAYYEDESENVAPVEHPDGGYHISYEEYCDFNSQDKTLLVYFVEGDCMIYGESEDRVYDPDRLLGPTWYEDYLEHEIDGEAYFRNWNTGSDYELIFKECSYEDWGGEI